MKAGVDRVYFSDSMKPIYMQIAEWLELEILSGNIVSDDKVYSQYQLAQMFNINPATAAKGLNILADEDILYKRRGLGMFVSPGASEGIRKRRKKHNLRQLALELIQEADHLGITETQLVDMVKKLRREKEEEQK